MIIVIFIIYINIVDISSQPKVYIYTKLLLQLLERMRLLKIIYSYFRKIWLLRTNICYAFLNQTSLMYNYCFFLEHSSNIAEQNKKKYMFIILQAYTCHLFAQDINITGQRKRRVYQISIVIFHFFGMKMPVSLFDLNVYRKMYLFNNLILLISEH